MLTFAAVRLAVLIAVIAALATVDGAEAANPYPAGAQARSVALSDATVAPSVKRTLAPGASVTYTRACPHVRGVGRYLTETSAYRGNGGALGPQRWNSDRTLTFWQHPRGGRVTFDGITFRNATRARVIVAGWCS